MRSAVAIVLAVIIVALGVMVIRANAATQQQPDVVGAVFELTTPDAPKYTGTMSCKRNKADTATFCKIDTGPGKKVRYFTHRGTGQPAMSVRGRLDLESGRRWGRMILIQTRQDTLNGVFKLD